MTGPSSRTASSPAFTSTSSSSGKDAEVVPNLGKCRKHESDYGTITWDPNVSATCPLCDCEQEINLQSKALIYVTNRLANARRAPSLSKEEEKQTVRGSLE